MNELHWSRTSRRKGSIIFMYTFQGPAKCVPLGELIKGWMDEITVSHLRCRQRGHLVWPSSPSFPRDTWSFSSPLSPASHLWVLRVFLEEDHASSTLNSPSQSREKAPPICREEQHRAAGRNTRALFVFCIRGLQTFASVPRSYMFKEHR